VTQAAAGVLREQGSGHLVQVSSIGGVLGYLSTGLYSAGKFALEGMSEAIAAELEPFGVAVSIVEPGGYWTALYDNVLTADPLDAYAEQHRELDEQFAEGSADSAPELAASALRVLVDSDDPPRRLILGGTVFDYAIGSAQQRIDTWKQWEPVSRAAENAIADPR
jgi:NAD(P)-dependent dehydrogenase (short-subunit alcohol dehydrogenase family)